MQQILRVLALIAIVGFFSSCNKNKLKNNEAQLVKTILSEEEQQENERIERERALSAHLDTLPKGFRFQEERGVDLQFPPLVIDIAGSLDSVKDVVLSDVAHDIEYIRLQSLTDSTISTDMKYKYYLMNDNIVAVNIFGIHLFDRAGHFRKTIIKNNTSGISYNKERDRVQINYRSYSKVGASTDVWIRGNDIFYNYRNTDTGQRYIMEYNCSEDTLGAIEDFSFDPEMPNKITGAGKISVDFNFGRKPSPRKSRGKGARTMDSDYEYSQISTFSPDKNTIVAFQGGKSMLSIFGNNGNVLSTFAKNEQLKNYSKNVARGTDKGTKYEINGNVLFRSEFNDTVFQLIPPNKILPKYVLNLGQYKMSIMEGKDPGVSLEGKIVPMGWADTRDFLFLTFSKDNYSCPTNRREKNVKIYHAVYSKKEQKLTVVDGDPTDYAPNILKNDIDGGVSVWPASYMVGNKGEILISLKGEELKDHINSKAFAASSAPEAKKAALKALAQSVSEDESILMIVR